MNKGQIGFFDEKNRYEKLTELGDPLEKLNDVMDWEIFRGELTRVCQKNDRLSFMRFLGLGLNDKVLDAKTLWDFENTLANADMGEKLFCMFDEVHFGYKNHVKCDAESKLITNYAVTDAALHDSNRRIDLLDEEDEALYADSAYFGSTIADNLPEGCRNCICEKGCRNHPLTEKQKENNREKSKIRCRIEHIFGFMTCSMHGISIRATPHKNRHLKLA